MTSAPSSAPVRPPFVAAMVGALLYAQRLNAVPTPLSPVLLRTATRRNEAGVAYLNRTVDDVVRARLNGPPGEGDLLDRMLRTAHPETGERLTPENIRRQVITFLTAGHETTSGALSFAPHYLSQHPEVATRARAEVDRVWGDTPEPAYDQVAELRYLRRVLDESPRLWPTAPAFAREAREATVLGGVRPMLRGAWALVLTPLLHREPEAWGPDAERFDPDRFEPRAVRSRPGHTFKPFGTGARACIGRQFALHEATLVLGLLPHRYELRPDPAYRPRVAERLTLMPEGLTPHLDRRSPAPSTRPETPADVSEASEASSASSCPVTGAGE